MSQYRLAQHAFVCVTKDYPVILDLENDRYIAVAPQDSVDLQGFIEGWPAAGGQSTAPAIGRTATEPPVIQHLLEQGLISPDPTGKPATPPQIEAPEAALIDGYEEVHARLRVRDIARVAAAAGQTIASLRALGLSKVIRGIRKNRMSASHRYKATLVADDRALVAMYSQIRPFIFTSRKACMIDSIVMSQFLSGFGSLPHCVFGVRSSPFAAHCWVQRDGLVYNDTAENVRKFTPILVI